MIRIDIYSGGLDSAWGTWLPPAPRPATVAALESAGVAYTTESRATDGAMFAWIRDTDRARRALEAAGFQIESKSTPSQAAAGCRWSAAQLAPAAQEGRS